MAGMLMHVGATVICPHGGQAQPTVPNPRVTVGGQPVVYMGAPYAIAGCSFVIAPCVTGTFVTAATRVTAGGQPVLLSTGQSVCAPTPGPMTVIVTQTRVSGQ
jgi:hypothetical protein